MRTKLVCVLTCGIVAASPGWAEPPDLEPLSFPTLGAVTAASAPALGTASLTVDQQIHLGAASDLFKDGAVFLWDDAAGNLALGRAALSSATGYASSNTAVGAGALLYTTAGGYSFNGSYNTAIGAAALRSNITGFSNTAGGSGALRNNTSGAGNTAIGALALFFNYTGSHNVAIGRDAGFNLGYDTMAAGLDYNIFIANEGGTEDAHTIRIGTQGTQNQTFIAGIHSASSLSGTDIKDVCVNDAGQLGPCPSSSSQRFKEAIRDMGQASSGLLALRPVTFRFKAEVAGHRPRALEFGLIAEEVAKLYPALVTYDEEGLPYGVRYQVLIPMLLNELQKQHAEVEALRRRLARLEKREEGIP